MVVIIIVVSVVILILIVIIIANNLFMVNKVNKAGRMAEQCGRKGAKQQVELIIMIMIRITVRMIDILSRL